MKTSFPYLIAYAGFGFGIYCLFWIDRDFGIAVTCLFLALILHGHTKKNN